jgi:hypothetical protein
LHIIKRLSKVLLSQIQPWSCKGTQNPLSPGTVA